MKPFDQFFTEVTVSQAYNVANVYVRGSRVGGETMAASAKQAMINIVLRNLTPLQRQNPREFIYKALDTGGYIVKPLVRLDPRSVQRDMTVRNWFPTESVATNIEKHVGNKLPPDVNKAFVELANNQRDAPESAMMKATMFHHGVWSFCLEHIGDLTHRMAQDPNFYKGGQEYVSEKVRKCLRYLTQDYGFAREVEGNMKGNFEHSAKEEGGRKDGLDYNGYVAKCRALGKAYSEEHKKLVVYNEAQWYARQAAIDIGLSKFNDTVLCLYHIEAMLKGGWTQYALTYYTSNGNLIPYTPGLDKSLEPEKI